jgi:hypothetical protein
VNDLPETLLRNAPGKGSRNVPVRPAVVKPAPRVNRPHAHHAGFGAALLSLSKGQATARILRIQHELEHFRSNSGSASIRHSRGASLITPSAAGGRNSLSGSAIRLRYHLRRAHNTRPQHHVLQTPTHPGCPATLARTAPQMVRARTAPRDRLIVRTDARILHPAQPSSNWQGSWPFKREDAGSNPAGCITISARIDRAHAAVIVQWQRHLALD